MSGLYDEEAYELNECAARRILDQSTISLVCRQK